MFRQLLLCACLIGAFSLDTYAQNSKSFKKKMNFWMGWYHIPGAQIVILKDGKIANSFNFGKTTYRGDIEVNNETRFQVGKVNQIFTSLALMREISAGRINPNVELNEQLLNYKLRNSVLNKRIKTNASMLLNHSGGINRPYFKPLEKDITIATIDLLKGSKLTGKKKIHNFQTPLKSYLYSEGAFVIARQLIEESSGMDYLNYLNTHINNKLDVKYEFNGYVLNENQFATPHDYSKWAFYTPYKFPNPSGYGCWMTAKEYGNLILKILGDDQLSNALNIKSNVYDSFTIPSIKIKDTPYSSCSVFEKHDYEKGVFRLLDTRYGYRSIMYYDTSSNEGFIILMNSEHDYMFKKHDNKVFKKFKKFLKRYKLLTSLPSIEI